MGIEMSWAMYTYAVVTVMHVSSDTCTICMVYWHGLQEEEEWSDEDCCLAGQ